MQDDDREERQAGPLAGPDERRLVQAEQFGRCAERVPRADQLDAPSRQRADSVRLTRHPAR